MAEEQNTEQSNKTSNGYQEWVDKNTLIQLLGGEEKAKSIFINPAVNFMSGKVTTTFKSIENSKSTIYVVKLYQVESGESILLKTKKFTQLEKANYKVAGVQVKSAKEWIEKDKNERFEKFKESYAEALANNTTTEDELKALFDKQYVYKINNNDASTFQSIGAAATTAVGAYAMGKSLVEDSTPLLEESTRLMTKLSEMVVSKSMEIVTTNVDKITTHALLAPQLIKKYSDQEFKKNKKTIAEVIKEKFDEDQEDQLEKKRKEYEEKSDQDKQSKFMNALKHVQAYASKFSEDTMEVLSKVTPYIEEGPTTLLNFINNAITEQVSKYTAASNKEVDKWMTSFDDWCKKRGEIVGQQLASAYNEALEDAAENMKHKLNTEETYVKIMAFSIKQKAALKIAALTGINIKVKA